jgi:hypothetical protein
MRRIFAAAFAAAVIFPAVAQQSVGRLPPIALTPADVRRLIEAEPPETRARVAASPELLDRLVRTELVRRALLANSPISLDEAELSQRYANRCAEGWSAVAVR